MSRRCSVCSGVLGDSATVCGECGSFQQTASAQGIIECENHQDETAVGCCVVCGKPVCGDCSRSRNGKLYCDEPGHERLLEEWGVLVTASSGSEADMIAVNLQQRGLEPRVFPRENHIMMFWFPELRHFRVVLPKEKLKEGKEILAFLGLAETTASTEQRKDQK